MFKRYIMKTDYTRIKIFVFFLLSLIFIFSAMAQEKDLPVDIEADTISFDHAKKQIVATGNVIISQNELSLHCQEAIYDSAANKAYIEGDVEVHRGEDVSYGKNVVYDFSKKAAVVTDTRVYASPFFGKADEVQTGDDGSIVLHKGYVTTCDLDEPHYKLEAKKITIYPGDRIKARGMVMKVGKVPVFYFPYISIPINGDEFPFSPSFGKDGELGYYVLTRWRYILDDNVKGAVDLDYYEKRGWGLGLTHQAKTKKYGNALFKYYTIKDNLYSTDNRSELYDEYPERAGIAEKYLDDDRYKAQLFYDFKPMPNLTIKAEINKFSDKYFMKDFFYDEYEKQNHPLSYMLMDYSFPNSSLSLFTQKRLNNFYTETEYLPQLEYNMYKHNIGSSKFYFESKEKAGYLQYKPEVPAEDSSVFRFYTHNKISYSDRFGFLSITPYVAMYNIYYSQNKYSQENVLRTIPEAGITLSTKFYKYFDLPVNFCGETINEFRHILTPEISYSYMHDPTVSDNNLIEFDDDDTFERSEKIIFKLKNKIQAKNDERVWDFIYFSPALEYNIDNEAKGSYFDKLTTEFEFYPTPNISVTTDTEYSIVDEEFVTIDADATYSKKKKMMVGGEETEKELYAVSLGQRYVRNENTEGTAHFRYQMTPKIQFQNYMRYDFEENHFERQEYVFRTDMHCWWLDLGINVDRPDSGGRDLTFFFMFTLKEYPRMHMGFDHTFEGGRSEY
ncbi:MAG: LptA/OstA family protein [Candidatus Omnitrophica bacterium]|nr:LptA/OstA family protein [Candidatus Omnitrophota bacterium]